MESRKRIEDLQVYVQKFVNRPLTDAQCERVRWALDFTLEALVTCGVPYDKREKELNAVAKELVEEFNRPDYPYGEPRYPNAQTELVWTKRASSGWMYCSTAGAAGRTVGHLPRAEGQGSARLGKGNGSEVTG